MNDIALNLNTSLSSSEQVSPNFWTDPSNGTPYYLAVQTPEYRVARSTTSRTRRSTEVHDGGPQYGAGLLSNVATLKRDSIPTNTNQANIQPVYEIYANADGRDLGSISGDIGKIVAEVSEAIVARQPDRGHRPDRQHECRVSRPRHRHSVCGGVRLSAHGGELSDLGRPVRRHPGAAGDVLRHRHNAVHTGTTLSVPSLMGAIMAIGVASANSILLVTFAREQQLAGMSAFDAAISPAAPEFARC